MKPRLVVLSGYPSSGKSTIARFMQHELGFLRLGSDDYREMLFGRGFAELIKEPGYLEEKEYGILWPMLDRDKAKLLSNGHDVVVDSTATYNNMRNILFNTRYGHVEISAEKYLLLLRVDRDELLRRDHPDAVALWDKEWEEPEHDLTYEMIEHTNNTPEDREMILGDLKRRFEKRSMLWVPKI